MNNPKFQIFKGNNDKFYFRLYAKNGQQVLSSQGYASKASAKGGAESVQKNVDNDALYERKEAANGKFFFNLLAANKQIIGTSQMYASKSGRDNGVEAIKRAAGSSNGIEDATA